jgi:uncharacterized membrane protein (DUF4010 family)
LIGAERERRKHERPIPASAGIRTFTVTALAGALALLVGGPLLLAVTAAAVSLLTGLAYWRTRSDQDPGLTTEIALVLTLLIGALAISRPGLAAGLGAITAILLAARGPMHHFVDRMLSETEVRDGLILAGASLVVLPLLPDQAMGPFQALNPRSIWMVLVLVLAIGAAGHVAVRALGARFGLPLAGLASGFVSSTATIGAMGARAAKSPALRSAAVAGAVLSTVATVLQMAVLLAATSLATLAALAPSLICAGAVAMLYGAVFTLRALRAPSPQEADAGQAFSLKVALILALTLAVVLLASAALRQWFGAAGLLAAAALSGLADAHAATVSVAALAAAGRIDAQGAVIPILAALTANTVSKIVFAFSGGDRGFALRVIPGLILVAVAAWVGTLVPIGP